MVDIYQVAEVGERQGVVTISCTDRQEAEEILAEVRRLFPDYRVRSDQEYTADSGDETGWLIDKCGGRHRYALWWLVRRLCSRGWKPFAVAHEPSRAPFVSPLYLFRKKIQP
jgi:hypothetical protein